VFPPTLGSLVQGNLLLLGVTGVEMAHGLCRLSKLHMAFLLFEDIIASLCWNFAVFISLLLHGFSALASRLTATEFYTYLRKMDKADPFMSFIRTNFIICLFDNIIFLFFYFFCQNTRLF